MINTNLLKAKIIANGFTQERIAQKMGMSKNTFSSKINNKAPFNIAEVFQLCELLHIESAEEKCAIFLAGASQ